MITVNVRGLNGLIIRFENMPSAFRQRVDAAAEEARGILYDQVRSNISRMFSNPAKMLSAIGSEVVRTGDIVTVTINASGRISGVVLPYMGIHEYGGRTSAHTILPVNARALHFLTPGALGFGSGPRGQDGVFAKRVNHPGSRIPERSYLRAALAQRKNEVVAAFERATVSALKNEQS